MQYAETIGNQESFIEVVFAELIGRAPHNEFEDQFMATLKKSAVPDQVMSFLMSELFITVSNKWEDDFIAAKIRRIARKLSAGEPTYKAVA